MNTPYRTTAAPEAERLPRDGFAGSVVFVIFIVGLCMGALFAWAAVAPFTPPAPRRTPTCIPHVETLNDATDARCEGAGATVEVVHGRNDYLVCHCPAATDGGIH